MMKQPHTSAPRRDAATSGFTLVEVAIALLAIGLGLVAIFGLGNHGLENSREVVNETRCQQFADTVFSTLQSYNTSFIQYASTNANNRAYHWHRIWKEAIAEGLDFPEIAGINNSTNIMRMKISTGGDSYLYPAFDENNISLLEWNPYYKLSLSDGSSSAVARGVNYLNASLVIYPDGNTYSSEARIYTTTLLFTGGLP